VRMDDDGVLIRSPSGAEQSITWDRVRDVQTGRADPALEKYRTLAMNLWRARSRLERGDSALAEPLFERLFADYRGDSGETALIVAEGLLRCRLARGANEAAVVPMLEVARLRHKGVTTIAYGALPPVLDQDTLLCPRLPPAWISTAGLARVDDDLRSFDSGGDPVIGAMAGAYRAAVRQRLGASVELPAPLAQEHPGATLLRMMLEAQASSADRRAAARSALAKRLPNLPSWAQAWAHFASGMSLLADDQPARQQSGLVELAHVPASYEREQPYLAALALAVMADALERQGDAQAAATLRGEVSRILPDQRVTVSAPLPPSPPNDASPSTTSNQESS